MSSSSRPSSSSSSSAPSSFKSSISFSSIPLEWLALVVSHLSSVKDHTAIHRTNLHWRRLHTQAALQQAPQVQPQPQPQQEQPQQKPEAAAAAEAALLDASSSIDNLAAAAAQQPQQQPLVRYSHAYSTVGFVLPVRWQILNSGLWENCSFIIDTPLRNVDERSEQPLAIHSLAGLQRSFTHMNAFSANFDMINGNGVAPSRSARFEQDRTAIIKRAVKKRLHDSLYNLLGAFTSIQYLTLIDNITEMSTETLGKAMKSLTTLRQFHYDVPNIARLTYHAERPPISNFLVDVLVRCPDLQAIGGVTLVQSLSEAQWFLLFSRLSNLSYIASIDWDVQVVLPHFRRIVARENEPHYSPAVQNIRRLRNIHPYNTSSSRLSDASIEELHHLGCSAILTLGCASFPANSHLAYFQNLIELDLFCTNMRNEAEWQQVGQLKYLHQLHLEGLAHSNTIPYILACLNELKNLKSLILSHSTILTDARISAFLSACPKLLHLKLAHLSRYNGGYGQRSEDCLTVKGIKAAVKLHASLHLLNITECQHVDISEILIPDTGSVQSASNSSSSSSSHSSSRFTRLLEYDRANITWLDLLTLNKYRLGARTQESSRSRRMCTNWQYENGWCDLYARNCEWFIQYRRMRRFKAMVEQENEERRKAKAKRKELEMKAGEIAGLG